MGYKFVDSKSQAKASTSSTADFPQSPLPEDHEAALARVALEFANKFSSEHEIAFTGSVPGKWSSTSEGENLRVGSSSLEKLYRKALPKDKIGQIRKAISWSEEDDLLNRLIEVKTDFSIMGFNLSCKLLEGSEIAEAVSSGNREASSTDDPSDSEGLESKVKPITPEQQAAYDKLILLYRQYKNKIRKIQRKWEYRDIVRKLMEDFFATDSMILYWKINEQQALDQAEQEADSEPLTEKELLFPGLLDVTALSPGDVDWDNSFGSDRLRVVIPNEIKERISRANMQYTQQERNLALQALLDEGIPLKYIIAVKRGQEFVDLDKDDGDNWLIKTRARRHHGLAKPSMFTVFLSLEMRKALREGDFSASFMMKHFILHLKAGEAITQGPLAGQRVNYLKPKEAEALYATITDTNKAARMVTNHTVTFDFVFPPKEMFDGAKYTKSEETIYNWAGVSIVLFSGEGGTYGSGFLSIKRLIAHIEDSRENVDWIITEFFDDPQVREALSSPEDSEISAVFDRNALKEPKQLLDEIRFMVENGMGDPTVGIRELGRNVDEIRSAKAQSRDENNKSQVWEPVYERDVQVERNIQTNAGRPPNDNTTINEDTRTQPPLTR